MNDETSTSGTGTDPQPQPPAQPPAPDAELTHEDVRRAEHPDEFTDEQRNG